MGWKCSVNQNWDNNKWRWECKNSIKHRVCKEDYVWNPSTCDCEIDTKNHTGYYFDTKVNINDIIWKSLILVYHAAYKN